MKSLFYVRFKSESIFLLITFNFVRLVKMLHQEWYLWMLFLWNVKRKMLINIRSHFIPRSYLRCKTGIPPRWLSTTFCKTFEIINTHCNLSQDALVSNKAAPIICERDKQVGFNFTGHLCSSTMFLMLTTSTVMDMSFYKLKVQAENKYKWKAIHLFFWTPTIRGEAQIQRWKIR